MIDFTTVTREFRSLVARRQELNTFLGSVFAALGIVLQNTLQGNLPDALGSIREHVFLFYAVMVLVPSLILALRMARLHGGMVIQGMLYARLMQTQTFTKPGDVEAAARHNVFGVSFLQFLVADFLAGFSASVVGLALGAPAGPAALAGLAVFAVWVGIYRRFHDRAAAFARGKVAAEACEPFDRQAWEGYVAASLEDANNGLIANLSFVGLMVFSVFEVVSGLGAARALGTLDLGADQVRRYGTGAYLLLMLAVCLAGLVINARLRLAVGRFSLDLDPTDRPFRPLVLTDSQLGQLLLAFLTAVATFLVLTRFAPGWPAALRFGAAGLALALAVLSEQVTLVVAGRKYGARPALPASAPASAGGESTAS